ncbi:MAG TPA: hypothetical protein VMT52_18140, partial [Planctomycetota bacterium]|nr:hypothetical protein [Planctomycetota bacterium]
VSRTFLPALGALPAASPTELPVSHARRTAGQSKYSLSGLVGLTLDLMTCFSLWPLRVLIVTGGVVCLAGMGLGLFILAGRIVHGAAWASEGVLLLFSILLAFVGGQFIAFGLLGEYVGRILQEVRDRPPYVLRKDDDRGAHGSALRVEAKDAGGSRG